MYLCYIPCQVDKETYNKLFKKYLNNELSADELLHFLNESEANEDLFMEEIDHLDDDGLSAEFKEKKLFENLITSPAFILESSVKVKKLWLSKLLKIAAILLTFGALSLISYRYIYNEKATDDKESIAHISKNDVLLSGKNSVTLKLPNGKKLVVDEANFSDIIMKEGITLSKGEDGSILFKISDAYGAGKTLGFHTFSTPKGESFAFVLPDGSKIWLNSNTQLKIPVNFNAETRDVYLVGEAYFDVVHNANKPFKIHTANDVVKVLGTQFNIKAYQKQSYNYTTLLRGSVLVTVADKDIKLIPGEQAVTNNSLGTLTKRVVDVDQVIGWKNGYFKFTDQPIEDIFDDLRKWYDIQGVDYETTKSERFTASIKRTRSLAEVLEKIEKVSSLRFKIEEGRVEVTEK